MKLQSTQDLATHRETLIAGRPARDIEVTISKSSTCCFLKGSRQVADAFDEQIGSAGLSGRVGILHTGCLGFCEIEPIVMIRPLDILYQNVKPKDVPEIIAETIQGGKVIDRLLYVDPATGEKRRNKQEISFYQKQYRLVSGPNETLEPTSLDDYIRIGGYAALAKALTTMQPEGVIEEVKKAGLRGRGGGGFLTARKWATCRNAESDDGVRYIICNADEGDPGAYMDRSVLEGNPHAVLEGMAIGSFAIGSGEGYIYVRAEYPLAVEHLKLAISQAEERGLLGSDILGTGHDFHIKIVRGAGAFVCGESTALMASLEGKVGRPRAKYVHTVEKGLWNRPSCLNNVETWANVPVLVAMGAEEYAKIGTGKSKGTKIFSLVGKINNTGLVEVPMGITLREIIFGIGGGIPGGRKFKAVQTGGPSGGCIPESLLDSPVDFDELTKVGSMMGSGGMIVMDEDTCMVDVARYFVDFLKGESCGKCVACREGVTRMLQILTRICEGEGTAEDLPLLEEIGDYLKDTALCALGSTAANPVLTTLRYFRGEYESHINEKYCPAGVCKRLFQYEIDREACKACGLCRKRCSAEAIEGAKKEPHQIDIEKCIMCGVCFDVCTFGAVKKVRVAEVAA